jgi:hypothetical protein
MRVVVGSIGRCSEILEQPPVYSNTTPSSSTTRYWIPGTADRATNVSR